MTECSPEHRALHQAGKQLQGSFLIFLQVVNVTRAVSMRMNISCSCISCFHVSSPLGAQIHRLLNAGLMAELTSPKEYHWLGRMGSKGQLCKISCCYGFPSMPSLCHSLWFQCSLLPTISLEIQPPSEAILCTSKLRTIT